MNKKKIFNIIMIPFKILLILVLAYGIYYYFDEVFEIKDVDRAETLHSLPEDSLDVVVLGSSHAQYSFVPSIFYEDTGLYSIVLGSACQPLEVSYQMLRESLKNQKPDFVILEAYTSMPLRKVCEADVCYVKAQYMMTGEEKYNTIDYLPPEKAATYYNEFINNHNNWRELTSFEDLKVDFKKDEEPTHFEGTMGYIEQLPELPVENYWNAYYFDKYDEVELDDLDLESLNNILDLCRQNDIELILYKTPIDGMDQENYNYLNQVWEWCNDNDVKYIDMIAIQDEIDFKMVSHSDSYHCNIVGANTITTKIGSFVNEEYLNNGFTTSHEENPLITEMYDNDLNSKALHVFEFDRNVYRALNRVKNTNLSMVVRYIPGIEMEERLSDLLVELGVSENFDLDSNYFAIIENGELVIDSTENPIKKEIDGKELTIDSTGIYINGESLNAEGNLNIAVYDNLDNLYLKNINIEGYPWELGYDYFIKK